MPLVEDGEVWGRRPDASAPDDGPYLACDDRNWRIRCGIGAGSCRRTRRRELEDAIRDGDVVARVKVDGRGQRRLVARAP